MIRHILSRCSFILFPNAKKLPSVQQLSKVLTYNFSSNTNTSNSSGNEDILAAQLRRASIHRLMDLIDSHSSVMNNDHLVSALESLFLFKKEKTLPDMFIETPHFKKLSKRLQRRAQFFQVDEVVNILKFLSFLDVPSSSYIMQIYFQMLRHQINDLDLKQLLYLEFLLKKQESSPLVEALKIALPLVVENHLLLQIDRDNLTELVHLFSFGVENGLSVNALQTISDAILQCRSSLSVMSACNLLWCCIRLRKNQEMFLKLFNHALEILVSKNEEVPPAQLVSLVSNFNHKRLFCATLINLTCKRAVIEKWPFSLIHTLICTMTTFDMFNTKLLEYYALLLIENKSKVVKGNKISVLSIIEAFAKANFFPRNLSEVLQILADSPDKLDMLIKKPELYLRLALSFATLNCYPPAVFGILSKESFIHNMFSLIEEKPNTVKVRHLQEMLVLSQLCNLRGYIFSFPEELRTAALNGILEHHKEFPLQSSLHHGLGGAHYVLSGIFTRSGIYMDHFIVLRQGDYPVALADEKNKKSKISQNFLYTDDIEIPSDAKRIAVIVHNSSQSPSSSGIITGIARLSSNLLSREGFHVVELVLSNWEEMPDAEKIPYLMRGIRGIEKQCAAQF